VILIDLGLNINAICFFNVVRTQKLLLVSMREISLVILLSSSNTNPQHTKHVRQSAFSNGRHITLILSDI